MLGAVVTWTGYIVKTRSVRLPGQAVWAAYGGVGGGGEEETVHPDVQSAVSYRRPLQVTVQ